MEPDIGIGLSQGWTLPSGETKPLAYGYPVMSGNNLTSPFGTLNVVNLGRISATHPDQNRTHIALDYVLHPRTDEGGKSGFMQCEVYRGPPMADIVAHLEQQPDLKRARR